MARVRLDHRTVALDRLDVGGVRVVREDQLATRSGQVISAEQQAGQRVGVDVTLEAHLVPALHVEHDAVPLVASGHDRFGASLLRQFEKMLPVEPVQPG
jgi:hypothetical protein